jgi:hypothetical protein
MATAYDQKVIDAYIQWVQQDTWDIFINLNFESGISKQRAIRAARNFCNREDVLIYKNKALRKNMRIKRAMCLEGDEVSNYHYHGVWQVPAQIDDIPKFCAKMLSHWNEVSGSGLYSKIEPIDDLHKVVPYICKRVNNPETGLCLETSHFG